MAPRLELCLPRLLVVSRACEGSFDGLRAFRPEFWPQGQTNQPTPFSAQARPRFTKETRIGGAGIRLADRLALRPSRRSTS